MGEAESTMVLKYDDLFRVRLWLKVYFDSESVSIIVFTYV